MKRTLILLILLLASPSWGATYHITATGAGVKDGATIANAWSPTEFNAASGPSGLAGDDTVLFYDDGGIFTTVLNPPASGTSGHPITLMAGVGEAPVLNTTPVLTSWTDGGSGVWSKTVIYTTCLMVYEDGVPSQKATSASCSDGKWYYDGGAKVVYYKPTSGTPTDHTVSMTYDSVGQVGMLLHGKQYITVDGLTFKNSAYGLYAVEGTGGAGPTVGIIVKNCNFLLSPYGYKDMASTDSTTGSMDSNYFYRVGVGSTISALTNGSHTSWQFTNNNLVDVGTIDGTIQWSTATATGMDNEALTSQNAINCTWSGNTVTGGKNHAFFLYTTAAGTSSGNVITRNTVTNNPGRVIYWAGATGNTFNNNTASYNLIVNSGTTDHAVFTSQGSGTTQQNYIYNNTIYGAKNGIYVNTGSPHYFTIQNNIFSSLTGQNIFVKDAAEATLVIDYNLYSNAWTNTFVNNSLYVTWANWKGTLGYDTNGVSADPRFTSSTNFHLLPGSPAINAGVDVSLTSDIEGRSVPLWGLPDIGAYEYAPGQHLMTQKPGMTPWQ